MGEFLKALLFGGAGYAIGNRISNEEVEELIRSYLEAVSFESLLRDWYEQHPGSNIESLISDYVETHHINMRKRNEYF